MTQPSGQIRAARAAHFPSGFTLLELIIVVLLIGLFMVVAIPALRSSLIDDPLTSSGRRLIGYLGGVRDLAIREQTDHLITVDLDANRIWYGVAGEKSTEELEPPEQGVFTPVSSVRLRDIWQTSTGAVNRGVSEVWVSRQGYMAKTVIHLENSDGDTLSFIILPFLPGVEVLDGYYEPDEQKQ